MIINNSFHIISLGCAKNTVDSESISLLLTHAGFSQLDKPDQAQFLIVNTCGFIQPARDESLHILSKLADQKRKKQYLIAAGCLTERYKDRLIPEIPKLDGVFGTRRWMDILQVVQTIRKSGEKQKPYLHFPENLYDDETSIEIPRVAIQGTSAYLKVADGCRHRCAFCAIPLIKGTKRSRPVEKIVADAIYLQKMGVKEINLIAQDTTDYGIDLGLQEGLTLLLREMITAIADVPWLRILYAFPGSLSPALIEMMAQSSQLLPYIDMPLQHAHPDILRKMQRPANMDWVHATLGNLKKSMPEIALRTTFIVGYPGETENEFTTLLDFVREIEFDHLGAFTYSLEEGTPAAPLGDPVSDEEKLNRLERLMLLQEEISERKNKRLVGKIVPVIIEGSSEGISVGRTYRDAPEIDGLTFIDKELPVGEIVNARISGAMIHDLLASVE